MLKKFMCLMKSSNHWRYDSFHSLGCLRNWENCILRSFLSISSLGMGLKRFSRMFQRERPSVALMVSVVMKVVLSDRCRALDVI